MADDIEDTEEKGEEKKEDFELLGEGEESIRQIDFNSIVFRQLDRTSRYGTEGNLGNFGNAVALLDALCHNLKDANYKTKEKESNDKFKEIFDKIEEDYEGDKNQNEKIQMVAHYQSEKQLAKLRLLMETLGRHKKV
jgi:hypothetical protein